MASDSGLFFDEGLIAALKQAKSPAIEGWAFLDLDCRHRCMVAKSGNYWGVDSA
jgi:hypothetical protein